VERGAVAQAEMAARELGRLSLMDALSLVVSLCARRDPRFEDENEAKYEL